jgi:hypothetical protein
MMIQTGPAARRIGRSKSQKHGLSLTAKKHAASESGRKNRPESSTSRKNRKSRSTDTKEKSR